MADLPTAASPPCGAQLTRDLKMLVCSDRKQMISPICSFNEYFFDISYHKSHQCSRLIPGSSATPGRFLLRRGCDWPCACAPDSTTRRPPPLALHSTRLAGGNRDLLSSTALEDQVLTTWFSASTVWTSQSSTASPKRQRVLLIRTFREMKPGQSPLLDMLQPFGERSNPPRLQCRSRCFLLDKISCLYLHRCFVSFLSSKVFMGSWDLLSDSH